MDLKEEEILGNDVEQHWYYRSKLSAVLILLKSFNFRHIVDIGSGSGFFARKLLLHTQAESAVCIDTSYTEEKQEVVEGKKMDFVKGSNAISGDLVLLMDVLEHVDDDVGLLSEYVNKLPSGTHFLISVPAFSFLWSGHDVFLEHKRRYTLPEIEEVVTKSGLEVIHGSYFYGLVFPLVVLLRTIGSIFNKKSQSQLKRHNRITNAILYTICNIDRLVIFRLNRLAGLSAFCLARKP